MRFWLVCILATALTAIIVGSRVERREMVQSVPDIDRLAAWMTGSFSSQEQASLDSDFFDIRLEMVQIWTGREDGPWLYVEQAAATNLARPYRQRVYHLTQTDDSTLASTVFEFAEPLRLAGAWRTPGEFDRLAPDSLIERPGCAIYLRPVGDSAFVGSTRDRECLSDHGGAMYATSEVEITEHYLESWDRGYDSTDSQVWGAVKSGYRFKKLNGE